MQSFVTRLKAFIHHLELSVRAFEIECGITQGTVSLAIRENKPLSGKSIEKIFRKYTELNADWLHNGRGEMLIGQIGTNEEKGDEWLVRENELLKKQNQELMDVIQLMKKVINEK